MCKTLGGFNTSWVMEKLVYRLECMIGLSVAQYVGFLPTGIFEALHFSLIAWWEEKKSYKDFYFSWNNTVCLFLIEGVCDIKLTMLHWNSSLNTYVPAIFTDPSTCSSQLYGKGAEKALASNFCFTSLKRRQVWWMGKILSQKTGSLTMLSKYIIS